MLIWIRALELASRQTWRPGDCPGAKIEAPSFTQEHNALGPFAERSPGTVTNNGQISEPNTLYLPRVEAGPLDERRRSHRLTASIIMSIVMLHLISFAVWRRVFLIGRPTYLGARSAQRPRTGQSSPLFCAASGRSAAGLGHSAFAVNASNACTVPAQPNHTVIYACRAGEVADCSRWMTPGLGHIILCG